MRILPGSSLETPEVGEVLKRGHVVFSMKRCTNMMMLLRFLLIIIKSLDGLRGTILFFSSVRFISMNLRGDQESKLLMKFFP